MINRLGTVQGKGLARLVFTIDNSSIKQQAHRHLLS